MRWIPLAILVYLLVLIQTTVGRVLAFDVGGLGGVGPDLLAIAAVFFALHLRNELDAVIAAWFLGFAADLTTAGGVGAGTVVGPMALAYAGAAWVLFRLREAFFRERVTTQALLVVLFCAASHAVWVTLQSLLAAGGTGWGQYWRLLTAAGVVSVYSGVLAPPAFWCLRKVERFLIAAPSDRRSRALTRRGRL